MTTTQQFLKTYQQAKPSLAGQEQIWLQALRNNASESLAQARFPNKKDEDWKYTRITNVENFEFNLESPPTTAIDLQKAVYFPALDCHRLVFVNGHFAAELSQLDNLPKVVTVKSLRLAFSENAELLQQHLGALVSNNEHIFNALNNTFMNDGAFIHIPKNTVLEKPIQLLFLTKDNEASILHPRNIIIAEEHSQATIIEQYQSLDDKAYLTNVINEVYCKPNSQLIHYKLQQESKNAFHIGTIACQQQRDSRYTSYSLALGAKLQRQAINTALIESGANTVLNGLYLAKANQHIDHHTCVDHIAPHCTSQEFYKGILDEKGKAVFNGKVIVEQDAQKSDTDQINKNLLLSTSAEVDTKPELEIFADEVKCTHGATVGQLDETSLFYLRSRGVPLGLAKQLLIHAFASEVVERINIEPIRHYLNNFVAEFLPSDGKLRNLV